ncbi:MAG: TetR/AcrR family transcriptional regulator [Gammaproteobacteria bacterium]
MRKPSKRDGIVETAFKLFSNNGFYATGVDLIMREAGVSKRTLYKYFPSKNELVVAVLEYYRETYRTRMESMLASNETSARDKIKSIFDDAAMWFGDVNFHGCLAVNAMGEFSGKDDAIENACIRFKRWELGVLQELCGRLDVDASDSLAYKLFVVLEGMSAVAQVFDDRCPIDMAVMADEMIDKHSV